MRPTWAQISLPALCHNYRTVQQLVAPEATVCAVVKADAYGHGAEECARALEGEGAKWFAVSSVDEGMQLRRAGIHARILLLSGFWRGDESDIVENGLTPAVSEWWQVELLEAAARRMQPGQTFPVHLKLNTGMNRIGMEMADLPQFFQCIKTARHVTVEGIFTHLASAEVLDAPDVECQLVKFDRAAECVRAAGLNPAYYHTANTAALLSRPQTWDSMVRPGLALYGYSLRLLSSDGTRERKVSVPLKPVLSWKTRVTGIRDVPAGQRVGYNGTYVTQERTLVATLPVGYADGFNRQLSSRGRVIVQDHYASILGSISMDLTLVDVTQVPGVALGDEVTIIGSSEHCTITAWEHANFAMTIPYEILCGISKRVPREYSLNGVIK